MPKNGTTLSALAGVMLIGLLGACGSSQKDGEGSAPPAEHPVNEEGWESPPPEQGGAAEPAGEEPAAPEREADPIGGEATGGTDVADDDVDAFARAYLEVVSIQQDFQTKLQGAGSQQEAEQLQVEAQGEIEEAIEGEGLTPEEFDELGQKIEQDQELRQEVEQKLQELQGPEAPGQGGMPR